MKPTGCLSDDCYSSDPKNGLEHKETHRTRLTFILNIRALTQAAEKEQ